MIFKLFALSLIDISLNHHLKCSAKNIKLFERRSVFDMELLKNVAQDSAYSNFLISPLCLKVALGIIMEGATGETAEEIRLALSLPKNKNLAQEKVKKWMFAFPPDNSFQNSKDSPGMIITNQIFVDNLYTIKEDYRTKLQKFYFANFTTVKKENPREAASIMAEWMEKKFTSMAPIMIGSNDIDPNKFVISQGTGFYFKMPWNHLFRKANTKLECFFTKEGDCMEIEMMAMRNAQLEYAYVHNLKSEIIKIPFNDGRHYMLILLPVENSGLKGLILNITFYDFPIIEEKLENITMSLLKLPKFTVEFRLANMRNILNSMHISRIFSSKAQLNNMVDGKTFLRTWGWPTYARVAVNENGIDAVNIGQNLVLSRYSAKRSVGQEFVIDHPFLFYIKQKDCDYALFSGEYVGPK